MKALEWPVLRGAANPRPITLAEYRGRTQWPRDRWRIRENIARGIALGVYPNSAELLRRGGL